jgi:hypothetical protein
LRALARSLRLLKPAHLKARGSSHGDARRRIVGIEPGLQARPRPMLGLPAAAERDALAALAGAIHAARRRASWMRSSPWMRGRRACPRPAGVSLAPLPRAKHRLRHAGRAPTSS